MSLEGQEGARAPLPAFRKTRAEYPWAVAVVLEKGARDDSDTRPDEAHVGSLGLEGPGLSSPGLCVNEYQSRMAFRQVASDQHGTPGNAVFGWCVPETQAPRAEACT
jgi:hypothetical protein